MTIKQLKNWELELKAALVVRQTKYRYISDIYDLLNLVEALILENDDIHKLRSAILYRRLSSQTKNLIPAYIHDHLKAMTRQPL